MLTFLVNYTLFAHYTSISDSAELSLLILMWADYFLASHVLFFFPFYRDLKLSILYSGGNSESNMTFFFQVMEQGDTLREKTSSKWVGYVTLAIQRNCFGYVAKYLQNRPLTSLKIAYKEELKSLVRQQF